MAKEYYRWKVDGEIVVKEGNTYRSLTGDGEWDEDVHTDLSDSFLPATEAEAMEQLILGFTATDKYHKYYNL